MARDRRGHPRTWIELSGCPCSWLGGDPRTMIGTVFAVSSTGARWTGVLVEARRRADRRGLDRSVFSRTGGCLGCPAIDALQLIHEALRMYKRSRLALLTLPVAASLLLAACRSGDTEISEASFRLVLPGKWTRSEDHTSE